MHYLYCYLVKTVYRRNYRKMLQPLFEYKMVYKNNLPFNIQKLCIYVTYMEELCPQTWT